MLEANIFQDVEQTFERVVLLWGALLARSVFQVVGLDVLRPRKLTKNDVAIAFDNFLLVDVVLAQ